MEKNVCMTLVEHMKNDRATFGGGEGEWQCILGKNMSATLNYDLHMLSFFDLI
jgi:dynein light chain LC8-type